MNRDGARVQRCNGATVLLIFLVLGSGVSAQRTGLTAAAPLARAYDAVFDARFDELPALLGQTCAPPTPGGAPGQSSSGLAPPEACQLLAALAIWWQIQLDPYNLSRDAMFQARADAAIAAAAAWTAREPARAEAWFYLGGAYGARAQWLVLRRERLAAARDGKRIKDALERSIALDPDLQDAYFGRGLYRYYADVAPTAAKMLRWLLLLPGGDTVTGMQDMLRARHGGQLLRSEADYQLHILYLWYEKRPEQALELLRALRDRHPRNPHFPQLIADVEDVYLHDVTASLRSWQALLDSVRARRTAEPAMADASARLGLARQFDRLFETDAAVPHLRAVIEARPQAPFGAVARAQLHLGQTLDRLGHRSDAVVAYHAAIAAVPPGDPQRIGPTARAALREPPNATTADAYRLSIAGWRALERGALGTAAQALSQSLALRPDDPVTNYRQARLLLAQGLIDDALTVFAAIHKRRDAMPAHVYLLACADAARVHEEHGAISIAIDLYRTALTVDGGDRRVKDAARRALIRLTAATDSVAR